MGMSMEMSGCVLRLTLDSPHSGNALDDAVLASLGQALDRAEADAAVRVLVIDATGPVFCSGADLGGTPGTAPAEAARLYFRTLRRITRSARTVVCVVDGAAQAGGIGLLAASDYVICSEQASFRLPEVLLGLIPACVLPFLIRRVGVHASQMLALSAHKIDARRALELHLVDQVAADTGEALRRLILSVARTPPQAVAALKDYMGRLAPVGEREEELAVAGIAALMAQPEALARVHELAAHGVWGGTRP